MIQRYIGIIGAGCAAGIINGLLGAGGGMLLVPLLSYLAEFSESEIFPASVAIMLPVCLVSLLFSTDLHQIPWALTACCLAGSAIGGILAGKFGNCIPVTWLHRILGIFVIWGGIRSLC